MTIQETINKAEEGGWKQNYKHRGYGIGLSIFDDPLFWQCLGKSLGWNTTIRYFSYEMRWIYEWHCFIDHLAAGKSIESFFEELTQHEI